MKTPLLFLQRAVSACLVLLAAGSFSGLFNRSRAVPVLIELQSRPEKTPVKSLQLVVPKAVLMRNYEDRGVDCYFQEFHRIPWQADVQGNPLPMLFFMRRGERLRIENPAFHALLRVELPQEVLLFNLTRQQPWLFQLSTSEKAWPFAGKNRLPGLLLCLLAGLLLPLRYAGILSAAALFAGLDLSLYPRFNPLKAGCYTWILFHTVRQWPELLSQIAKHGKTPALTSLSLLTSLLLCKVPFCNMLTGTFPAPMPLLILYCLLLFPVVWIAFLKAADFLEKIPAEPCSGQDPDFAAKMSYLLKRPRFHWLAAAAFLACLYVQNPLLFSKYKFFCKYRLGHFLYTCDSGFMPRALVGTVFVWLSRFFSQTLLFQLLYWCLAGIALFLILRLVRTVRNSTQIAVLCLLSGLYLSLPSTWLALAHDFARLDVFLLLTGIASLALIWRESRFKYLVLLLIPAGTMIHELFLFFNLPAILAVICWKSSWKENKRIGFLVAALASSTLAVLLFCASRKNFPGHAELIRACSLRDQYQVAYFSNYALSIADKNYSFHILNLGREIKANPAGFLSGVFFFLLAIGYPLCLWGKLLKTGVDKHSRLQLVLLMLGAFAPAAAALIIVDYARWQAAACHSTFLLLFFLLSDPETIPRLPCPGRKTILCTVSLMLLFLFSGSADWFYFTGLAKNITAVVNQWSGR